MQKIIGLDIGSYSIKAVEILNHLKSYEISGFYENVIPQIEGVPADVMIPTCMEQIFKENRLEADRIVTAMPGQYVSSRVMAFNFSDPRKINAAAFAEIEGAVPFNLEEMLVDSQVLGPNKGKTLALVVMTRKNFLKSFLEHLKRLQIDPKVVDVDSLAFYNLFPFIDADPQGSYAWVDVGHEKTSVCLVQEGMMRMFRSINLGGRYLTEFLSRDLEVSFMEAQRIKHRVSCLLVAGDNGQNLDSQDRLAADRMTIASNAIIKELGRTFYAFKNYELAPVKEVFLSGGSSSMKNFPEYLSEHLELKVQLAPLKAESFKMKPELSVHLPIMAQSMAVGLRAVTSLKKHSQINLRKGEFVYVHDYQDAFSWFSKLSKILVVFLTALLGTYFVKQQLYKKEIKKIQELYLQEIVQSVSDFKKNDKTPFEKYHRDATALLKEKILLKKSSLKDFLKLNRSSGCLLSLEALSRGISKDIKVNIVEYRYTTQSDGDGLLRLKVEAESFEVLANFRESLMKIQKLKDVEEKSSDAKPGQDLKVAVYEADYPLEDL